MMKQLYKAYAFSFYFIHKGKVKVKAICVCLILLQHVRRSPFPKFSVTYHTRYGGVNCHFCQKSPLNPSVK